MSNPILNNKFLERVEVIEGQVMTVNGTLQATAILGCLLLAAASFVWSRFGLGYTDIANLLTFGGFILGAILAIVIVFTRSKYLIPVYAVCEGLALGGISYFVEADYSGIVMQAIGATFAALFTMLILYRFRIIKATEKFKSVLLVSTVSIAAIYIVNLIGHFFGYAVPFIGVNDTSNIGIGVTGLFAAVAALNLIIDFDFIERGSEMMLPKDYEWYGAFGLMVTIVWLYIEILKLLSKLRRR